MEFDERKAPVHKIASHGFQSGNPLRNHMPSLAPAQIASIYRYPVKGLTSERLARTELKPGRTLLADRRYAIENGPLLRPCRAGLDVKSLFPDADAGRVARRP